MADQFVVGGVITSLLWFLFFYYKSLVTGLIKKTRAKFPMENCAKTTATGEAAAGIGTGTTDIIIVGAGVAGAALAYSLGKDGRRVRLIERDLNAPDRIAGEGLVAGGYLKLIELGLEDCVDEIDAHVNRGFYLYKDGILSAKIAFPLEKFPPHVAGRNFHNGRFVQRLRMKAASLDNVSLEQGTVTCLLEENGTVKGVHYKTKSGEELTAFAPLTIVCDGSFSNLRRSFCKTYKVDVPSYFVAVTLKNCKLPNPGFASIILGDPAFLFYPVSSTELRCMADVPRQNFPSGSDGELAHYLKTSVAPRVPPELYNDFISAIEDKNNIRFAQTRIMPAAPIPTPGALLIGDALNMRHPIIGGGMTLALNDVVLVRDLLRPLRNLNDPSAVCKYLESFYILRKPMASTMNTLACVLYKVLSASTDPAMEAMQRACIGYLNLGSICSNGLSGLISGLCPRPSSLAFHLLGLAIYGLGRLLLPFPSPKRLRIAARFISVGLGLLVPLIKTEGVRSMFFPQTLPAYYRSAPPASATYKNTTKVSSDEKRIPTN